MKTMIKVMSVSLAVLMLAMMLVACDTLSGSYSRTYESEGFLGWGKGSYTETYEFSGKKVTKTVDATIGSETKSTTTTGTYELTDDGKIVITWDKDVETSEGQASSSKSTYTFDKGDDFILIDGDKYTKN